MDHAPYSLSTQICPPHGKTDIVTMDICMPDKNGIEAIKKIIKIDKNAKIIVCSALGQEILVIEAIQAGIQGFYIQTV